MLSAIAQFAGESKLLKIRVEPLFLKPKKSNLECIAQRRFYKKQAFIALNERQKRQPT